MAMEKKNVFVVTGRDLIDDVPRGAIRTVVVCAVGDKGVRSLMAERRPLFGVTTITGLISLETRVKQIKAALAGEPENWEVLVDPVLE